MTDHLPTTAGRPASSRAFPRVPPRPLALVIPVLLLLLLLSGGAGLARPSSTLLDVVHLVGGGRIEGRVVAEDGDAVSVFTRRGVTVTVAPDDVRRIEREADPGPAFFLEVADRLIDRGGRSSMERAREALRLAREAGASPAAIDRRESRVEEVVGERRIARQEAIEARIGLLLHLGLPGRALARLEEVGDPLEPILRRNALEALADRAAFRGEYEEALELYGRAAEGTGSIHPARVGLHQYARVRLLEPTVSEEAARLEEIARSETSGEAAAIEAWCRLGEARRAAGERRAALTAFRRAAGIPDIADDPDGLEEARERALARRHRPLEILLQPVDDGWADRVPEPGEEPRSFESEHFRGTHHAPDDWPLLGSALEVWREVVWTDLGRRDAPPSEPVEVMVHPDREAFRAAVPEEVRHAGGLTTGPDRFVTHHQGTRLLTSLIPHELVHVAMARLDVPAAAWTAEGLAVRSERGPERYRSYLLVDRILEVDAHLPLEEVLRLGAVAQLEHAEDWRMFYAQAVTLVDMLCARPGGVERFLELVEGLGRRSMRRIRREARELAREADDPSDIPTAIPFEIRLEDTLRALRRTYGIDDLEGLDRAWRAHVRRRVDGPPEPWTPPDEGR